MNYEKILPIILDQEVKQNPKGYFSRLRLTHKRILKWIVEHTPKLANNATIGERVYWIIHGLNDYPTCKECHKKSPSFRGVIYGYGDFCSIKCTENNSEVRQKILAASIENFGKDNVNNRLKARQTCKELYGEEYFTNTQQFKDALQKFLNEKGVENTWQIQSIIEKCIMSKRAKYGDNLELIVDKVLQTRSTFSDKKKQQIRDKRIHTCQIQYGVDFSSQSPIVKEKAKATNRKNFGVDNPMQSATFRKQILGRKYQYDGKSFDSSDELAMYIWLSDHKIPFEYSPNIKFKYESLDGKERYYFPDFKIGNQLYEIKGDHFFKNGKMICPFKKKQWSNERYLIECANYEAKHQCMLHNNVKIVFTSSMCMKIVKKYVYDHYGKKYLKSFKKYKNKRSGAI